MPPVKQASKRKRRTKAAAVKGGFGIGIGGCGFVGCVACAACASCCASWAACRLC